MKRVDTFYAPIPAEHVDAVTVQPNLHYKKFEDIDVTTLLGLGVDRVMVDWDHTLVANQEATPSDNVQRKLAELVLHLAIKSVDVVTANTSPRILHALGWLSDPASDYMTMRVFQPLVDTEGTYIDKPDELYWKIALHTLGGAAHPERTVMIGDSPLQDIHVPQSLGMKTILLQRKIQIPNFDYYITGNNQSFAQRAREIEASRYVADPSLLLRD